MATVNRTPETEHIRSELAWPNYNQIDGAPVDYGALDSQLLDELSSQSQGALVHQVLNAFGISMDGDDISGELLGIDLKNSDAMSAIKMALLEPFAKGEYDTPLELIITPDGEATIVRVGQESGNISDVYTKVRTSTYDIPEVSVKITGKKARPRREVRDWVDVLYDRKDANAIDPEVTQETEIGQSIIWDTNQMVNDCQMSSYKRHAAITFKDPNLNAWALNDGEESIYEVQSVWEKVIGWLWYIDPGPTADKLTKINIKQQSTVPLLIRGTSGITYADVVPKNENAPNIGQLVRREVYEGLSPARDNENSCYEGLGTDISCDAETALSITLPENLRYTTVRNTQTDNFIKISRIYVVGHHLNICRSFPRNDSVIDAFMSTTSEEEKLELLKDVEVFVALNDISAKPYTLEEGIDYAIGYNIDTGQLCIQLINNADQYDFGDYGSNKTFKIYPNCTLSILPGAEDGVGLGTLIPKKGTGYLVEQLWAQVDLDIPCIDIFDPHGNALTIANEIRLEIAPIVLVDEPAPIAINGELVDQASAVVDSDPTTVQELQDTDYESKIRALNGTQIFETNMATLTADEAVEFSSRLRTLLNEDQGLEINYVCGPNCDPQLGGEGLEGGVINNITYSYTDMGSYTVSVTEGPVIPSTGLISGITGSERVKQTETLTANGTVIQDEGNSVRYKVLVEGFGIITAYSGVSEVIRVGDTVNVKINNVPVET